MLTAIITLPGDFISSILGHTGQLFTDLSSYIELILGVILGATVIVLIIRALRG